MLELIIERGMQILQTTEGEKLPRVVETLVKQHTAEPGHCQFTMYVNEPGLCRYEERTGRLITPGGKHLRKVEVLKMRPKENTLKPALVLCKCEVGFHYDTKHKAHYVNALSN